MINYMLNKNGAIDEKILLNVLQLHNEVNLMSQKHNDEKENGLEKINKQCEKEFNDIVNSDIFNKIYIKYICSKEM